MNFVKVLHFCSVVQYVTETWKKNSDNENGQQIRFLAGFYVDLNAQNARENEQDCDGFKQEALSVLKVEFLSLPRKK